MTIGMRIKELRKRAELTQDKFAELCDATKGAVSQWESNTTKPSLQNIMLLREQLRAKKNVTTSIDWILYGDGDQKQTKATPTNELRQERANYYPRNLVQQVCELAEQINDDGLRELIGFARCLTGSQPWVKQTRKSSA